MSRVRPLLACFAAFGVLALCGGTALADSGCGSAGDQQYVDPLGQCHTTPTATTPPPPTNSTATTPPATTGTPQPGTTTAPPATIASTTTTAASTGTSAADPQSSSGKLPFTGLNVWGGVGLGFGLLAAGFVVRRAVRTE